MHSPTLVSGAEQMNMGAFEFAHTDVIDVTARQGWQIKRCARPRDGVHPPQVGGKFRMILIIFRAPAICIALGARSDG